MNPIEYIEKCTLYDLLRFQEETKYIDVNKIERKSTKKGDLIYIAIMYLDASIDKISIVFNVTRSAVKSHFSRISNQGLTEMDRLDDLMREIAYWKYKQLNKLDGSKN